MWMVAANFRQTHSPSKSTGMVWVGGHPALSLHSSDEPGGLSQWLWSWWYRVSSVAYVYKCIINKFYWNSKQLCSIQGLSKSKLLLLSEYANETEKIGGAWANTNIYRENGALSDIFTSTIWRHNCFMLKYSMTESCQWNTARQTRTSLRKHDVIKVAYVAYNI